MSHCIIYHVNVPINHHAVFIAFFPGFAELMRKINIFIPATAFPWYFKMAKEIITARQSEVSN